MNPFTTCPAPSPPPSCLRSDLADHHRSARRRRCSAYLARALAAHRLGRHVDRPALLLQRRADARRWRRRPPTRAAPAAPASPSTSRRARCSGSAGPRSSPGSPVPGTCSLRQLRRRLHARARAATRSTVPARHRHRRVARHDHAVQRLGADLAEPEEDSRHRAGDGRGEGQGAQGGAVASRTNFVLSIPMLLCMGSRDARPALLTDARADRTRHAGFLLSSGTRHRPSLRRPRTGRARSRGHRQRRRHRRSSIPADARVARQ